MDVKKILRHFSKKLTFEAVLKAVLVGMAFGFGTAFLMSCFGWLTEFTKVWLTAVVAGAVFAISSVLFFFLVFRPSTKETAKRIDKLGLEERLLTMAQLENDNSYIAKKQREDALGVLKTVNTKLLKIVISVNVFILLAVAFVVGSGMTTVQALSEAGVIKSGKDIIEEISKEPDVYYSLNYSIKADKGASGEIGGNAEQKVKKYGNGEYVSVMCNETDAYSFLVKWDDGLYSDVRQDVRLEKNTKHYANVGVITGFDPDDIEYDKPGNVPGDPGDGPPQPAPGQSNDEGQLTGGAYNDINFVYDGNTYYGGTTYEEAYKDVMERLSQNDALSEADKRAIADYFDTIKE